MGQERTLDQDDLATPLANPASAPGRAPVTARLSPRPLVFRVESAEAARELGAAFGRRDDNGVAAGAGDLVQRAEASSGAALPGDVRARFEGSLGSDLSGVRVHTGADSQSATGAVGARAYTTGQDIHFAEGEYAPSDPFGLHLLAHEVAHTVQQAGAAPTTQYKLEVSSPGDSAELEADRAADAMIAGAPASVGAAGGVARMIQRDAKPATAAAPPSTSGTHTLTAAEKKDADTAKWDAMAARALFKNALAGMGVYKTQVPGALTALQTAFDTTKGWGDSAFDSMNEKIKQSGEFEAWKKEVAMQIVVGGFLAGVGGGIGGLVEANAESAAEVALEEMPLPKQALTESSSYFELAKSGREELRELGGEAKEKLGDVGEKMKDEAPATAATAPPAESKLAFYKQLAALHAISTNDIIPLYDSLAKLGEPIGEMVQAATTAAELGKTVGKITVEKMRSDVPKMRAAASTLQSAASKVPLIVKVMTDMTNRSKILLPKSQLDVEKQYWIAWVAQLDASDRDKLGETLIQQHLEKIGVWSKLGIHNPDGTHEENLAIWSARAQQKLLAFRGTAVTAGTTMVNGPGVFQGWNTKVSLNGLGDVGATWPSAKGGDRAIVVGAYTTAVPTVPIDTAALAAADDKVMYLIRHGLAVVELEAQDEAKVEKIDDDDGYVVSTPSPVS